MNTKDIAFSITLLIAALTLFCGGLYLSYEVAEFGFPMMFYAITACIGGVMALAVIVDLKNNRSE